MNKQTLETACKNYNPNRDYNGNYGHYLADLVLKQKEDERLEELMESAEKIKFVDAVRKSGVNIDNIFADAYEKQNLLKKIKGYGFLKGDKDSFGNNSDAKIGLAFRNTYYSDLKKIKEYERGEGK